MVFSLVRDIHLKGMGVCRRVHLSLLEVEVKVVDDFLPLKIASTDVILGMQWLGSLGNMQVNWQILTMK